MITFGCAIPGGSFMPEGVAEVPSSPDLQIIEKCRAVLAAGFDFTECGGGMLMNLDESGLLNLFRENEKHPLKIRAVNSLFPSLLRLADPLSDREKSIDYAKRIFEIMKELGAKYAVLGSGSARTLVPDSDGSLRKSYTALTDYIREIGSIAPDFGVTVVIEPLRKSETNVFNSVPESAEFVRSLALPGVALLYDAFHMAEEHTELSCVEEYASLVRHCHIAEAPHRSCPGSADSGDLSYNREFAVRLSHSGYSGGVSAECGFRNFAADLAPILKYMKEIFN